MPRPLGRLSAAQFLRRYWQRRPLLVRGAVPGFVPPVSPEELLGLSCEEGVESRLVLERGGSRPWQVVHGPQSQSRLRRLPERHWSLLVQGVDRLLPEVAALLRAFRFLPDWRIDDVMVSVAPRGGSVGPHVDRYDVFLLQGLGRRRWELDPKPRLELRTGLDLRVLRHFRPRSRHVLEPGDMLYLPAGVGHHGVALETGLTFSIGFRAPDAREVLAAALRTAPSDLLYRDPPLRPGRHPAEVDAAAVARLRRLGGDALSSPEFERAMGELLTEPKVPVFERRLRPEAVARRLRAGASLTRIPGARLAFRRRGRLALLFAEGQSFELSEDLAFVAPLFTDHEEVPAAALRPHLRRRGFVSLVARLVGLGAFQVARPRSS